jgi:hypothetical protein
MRARPATLTDLGHHVVYAATAGTVYDALSGERAAGWTRFGRAA